MKVLLFTMAYPPEKGGNARRARAFVEILTQAGHEVDVVSAYESYPFGHFKRKFGLIKKEGNVTRLWTFQPSKEGGAVQRGLYYGIYTVSSALYSFVKSKNYDVVITSSPPATLHLTALASRVKLVIDMQDLFVDVAKGLGLIGEHTFKALSKLEKKALSRADRILVTTPTMAEFLGDKYDLEDKFLRVDNSLYPSQEGDIDGGYFIYSGYVGHVQNLEEFIEAYAKAGLDVPIFLFGAGEKLKTVENMARRLGIKLASPGFVEQETAMEFVRGSSVGIATIKPIPELDYAVPSKVYDYLSSGKAFVGIGGHELRKTAEKSGAGCVGTGEELVDCILKVWENRKVMGKKGKEYYDTLYKETVRNLLKAVED